MSDNLNADKVSATVILEPDEKRELIAVVYYNAERDTLDFDPVSHIPPNEIQAMFLKYMVVTKEPV